MRSHKYLKLFRSYNVKKN